MPIMEAISAVSVAIDVAKGMRAAEKNFDAATYKIQIADLMTALSEARLELVAARESGDEKDAQFEQLKRTLDLQSELVEARGGFKYRAGQDNQPAGFPICPTCEQKDGRVVVTVSDGNVRKVRCPVCDARFDGVAVYAQTPAAEPKTLEDEKHRKQAEGWERLNRQMRDRPSPV